MCLLSKHEAINSIPSTAKKKKLKKNESKATKESFCYLLVWHPTTYLCFLAHSIGKTVPREMQ
jgi:hypothetical protein